MVVVMGLAVSSTLLVGCGADAPMPVPTPTYTSTYVAPPPTALAPLTGETIEVGALVNPAISAKVDNHPDARPQFALERADIVFEELVEGGITRYVAIWHSDIPDELGPIRSIRPMDPDIISPFGGIVAYAGGQQRFVDLMEATPVVNVIHGYGDTDETMYRTDLLDSPHDVIVRAALVLSRHLDLAPPAQQFAYSRDVASSSAVRDGEPIAGISLVFSEATTPSWTWDAAAGAYLRAQSDGSPDVDLAGTSLAAVNVVVLRVDVSYGYDVPKTELVGSGEAWVSTGGSTIHATWSKAGMVERITLVDDNGVAIRLAPGSTWIELVPLSGAVDFARPAA